MSLPIGLFGDVPVFPGCHDVQLRHLPIRVLRRDNISYVAQRAGSFAHHTLYSGIKEPLQNLSYLAFLCQRYLANCGFCTRRRLQ